MRRPAALFLALPALLGAQTPRLDEGRLDPAWFGPSAAFQASKALGFQWLRPGLDLRRRSLRLKAWEPPVWLLGKRALKDEVLAGRFEAKMVPDLAKGLKRGLKGAIPVSLTDGDVILVGRMVDAVGEADDGISFGRVSLSFDLKMVDGDTGELLGAFHETLGGLSGDGLGTLYARWCEDLGKALAPYASPLPEAAMTPPSPRAEPPAPPPFDLEGALRRIEGLRRDGLLSEEECLALRKKATARAK